MRIISENLTKREPLDIINARVRGIPPYTLKSIQAEVKVNQNENPFDFPSDLKEKVFERLREVPWCRYPDFVPQALIRKISGYYGWPEEGILVGNGSNELIQAIFMVTLDRSKRLVLPQPTFTLYKLIAGILGAGMLEVPLTEGLEFDVEEMCRLAATEHADVMVICSPNNPTGCQLSESALRRLLSVHRGLMVLDEAYCEFAEQNMFGLLRECDRLLIARTFSKAAGIAGLRVGYCLGNPKIIEQISKAKLPYSVNVFSLVAAELLFDALDTLEQNVRLLIAERERILNRLRHTPGITAFDSQANFIFFRVERDAVGVFNRLLERDILVRDVSRYPLLSGGLRVSVGTPEQNERFLTAVTEIMGQEPRSQG